MTKAEQKKMEKAARSMYITQAFGCVLDAICDSSQNAVRGKLFLQLHGNKFFHCTVSRFFTAW